MVYHKKSHNGRRVNLVSQSVVPTYLLVLAQLLVPDAHPLRLLLEGQRVLGQLPVPRLDDALHVHRASGGSSKSSSGGIRRCSNIKSSYNCSAHTEISK